ncbi:tail fiber assembly protein [Vagococcus sp. WN89Y]|uniref:tail fiber assembly protein n=1 Tax=Vagococcus sp. WN89Y TaxID=3457258 RepID=UPI003FCE4057
MTKAILNTNLLATEAGDIVVYNFAASTREFLSRTVEYLAAGVGIPANACTDAPPAEKAGFVMCRNSDNSGWQPVADHRNETVYDTASGLPMHITAPGDYPPNTTREKPASEFDTWDGSGWVLDDLAQKSAQHAAAENEKAQRLREAKEHINLWQTQLQLGMLSDSDKKSLIDWMNYIQALQAIDPANAPDLAWPAQPAQ